MRHIKEMDSMQLAQTCAAMDVGLGWTAAAVKVG